MGELVLKRLRCHEIGPVDLKVSSFESVVISGASGAGKTLLLRSIADLETHEGDVYLNGLESRWVRPSMWRKMVGMLPAESQWWHDKVGEHFRNVRPAHLESLGFEGDVLDWEISRLSSGERQRLALVRLLANEPEALLLDEPTANLDSSNAQRVEELIGKYRRDFGCSVLWISHDPLQIGRVADRHFVLLDGNLSEEPVP